MNFYDKYLKWVMCLFACVAFTHISAQEEKINKPAPSIYNTNLHQMGYAVKVNLLYGGLALAPNLGIEIGTGKRSTIELWGAMNLWNLNGLESKNKKLTHWIIQPEYRYWFCERFNGHYIGGHAFFMNYNIGGYKIPLLLENEAKDYRYKGNMIGAGIVYGYHWMLNKHFSLEFNIGAGYGRMHYDKYECPRCGEKIEKGKNRNYFGPTKAGINLVYVF